MAKEKPKSTNLTPKQEAMLGEAVAAETGGDPPPGADERKALTGDPPPGTHPTPDVTRPYAGSGENKDATLKALFSKVNQLWTRVESLERIFAGAAETPDMAKRRGVFDARKGVPMPAPGWNEPEPGPADAAKVKFVRTWVAPSGETEVLQEVYLVVLGIDDDWVTVEWPNGAGPQKFSTDTGEAEAPSLSEWHPAERPDDDDDDDD